MRNTKFIKDMNRDNRKYNIVKFKSFLHMKFALTDDERKKRQFSYSIFQRNHSFDRRSNALPDPLYYKPTDIILYDLIPKQDLEQTKQGLIRLYKKCYTHKYMDGGRAENDIEKIVQGLNKTLHNGKSWYRVGLFDFAYKKGLDNYIDHFEIYFHNFSSSYAAIEMNISLNEDFQDEIAQFIKTEYRKPGMCVHKHWTRNKKKKSGAKIGYAVSSGTSSECAKNQIIYEQLEYVKDIFLKNIFDFFPLMQYSWTGKVLGVNIFETNILPENELDYSIMDSLGIDINEGFYISEIEKLFVQTSNYRSRDSYDTDMMLVYNPEKIKSYDGYITAHNKELFWFTMDYMSELYTMLILKNIGVNYLDIVRSYRNKINSVRSNKKSQRKLLKLKYELGKDFYAFTKINQELPVSKEIKRANELLERNEYTRKSIGSFSNYHPYETFTGKPKYVWKQIKENYDEIQMDLDRKIKISEGLTAYSETRSNQRVAWFQLAIATITFVLVIFPEKALAIAQLIRLLWNNIFTFIK